MAVTFVTFAARQRNSFATFVQIVDNLYEAK